MAAWPGTLPQLFSGEGYTENEADNVLKSSMDIGPPKRRRRSTAATRTVRGNMDMTSAQLSTLKTFYRTTCAYGSLSFTRTDEHGAGVTCYFAAPPTIQYAGYDWWSVGLELEVLA